MSTIEQDVNPWEWMVRRWELFAPPGRPSSQDISLYREMLYRGSAMPADRTCRVLVLGATPEIRDMLAADTNLDVTLVDITIDMIMAMTKLMQRSPDRETWIRGDWVKAPLPANYFDAVISDLVICNVPVARQVAFLDRISSVLRDSGHWINRAYCVDANTQILDLESLFEVYSQMPLCRETVNNFRSHAGLIHWDPGTKMLAWARLLDDMNRYRNNGNYVHADPRVVDILTRTYELFKPFDKKYFLDTKTGTDALFASRFRVRECVRDESVVDLHEKGYYIYDLEKAGMQ